MEQLLIGIEIGATKCQASLGKESGDTLETKRLKVVLAEGAAGILRWMQKNVAELISVGSEIGGTVAGIGVGFGGFIESSTGRVLTSVQVDGWQNYYLKDWFENTFGIPSLIGNDTVSGAYGEYVRGSGKGTRVFFYTNIGSGIGGALILDGVCYDGMGYGGAYLGHTYIPDWTSAVPGAARKVEDICSGWAIEKRLRSQDYVLRDSLLFDLCGAKPETLTCSMLEEAARSGDVFALAEIGRIADSLSTGLANVITLFSPECVAIGGGVANMGEILLNPVRHLVAEKVLITAKGRYRIVPCVLADQVVPVGAILRAADFLGRRKVLA